MVFRIVATNNAGQRKELDVKASSAQEALGKVVQKGWRDPQIVNFHDGAAPGAGAAASAQAAAAGFGASSPGPTGFTMGNTGTNANNPPIDHSFLHSQARTSDMTQTMANMSIGWIAGAAVTALVTVVMVILGGMSLWTRMQGPKKSADNPLPAPISTPQPEPVATNKGRTLQYWKSLSKIVGKYRALPAPDSSRKSTAQSQAVNRFADEIASLRTHMVDPRAQELGHLWSTGLRHAAELRDVIVGNKAFTDIVNGTVQTNSQLGPDIKSGDKLLLAVAGGLLNAIGNNSDAQPELTRIIGILNDRTAVVRDELQAEQGLELESF